MLTYTLWISGPFRLELNALAPQLILLPLTVWLAAMITQLVDVPSVKLSKWLFKQRKGDEQKALEADSEMEAMLPRYHDDEAG